jgi:hypothetical protein
VIPVLGHDAFEPELASMPKDGRTVAIEVLVVMDAYVLARSS